MAVKTPIEAKIMSYFARTEGAEALKTFGMVRAILNDRGLLRRKGAAKGKLGRKVEAVAPAQTASGVL